MKRALFLMILSSLAVSLVTAQEPAKVAPKHYKVAAAEAPDPRVTPDGRYRLYAEEDGAGDEHLFLRDLTTGETRRLTKGPGSAGEAIMSPDGRLIAYAWETEDRLIELRIVGIDGSEPRVFYSNRDVLLLRVHEWSPDGKYVAATVFQRDRSQLVLVSVADASVRVVRTQVAKTLNASGQWDQMSFSPDGRFVAYDLSPQGGRHPRDIFAMSAEGGPEIPLVQHPANDLLLDWTPDGRGVLFASDRSGHWDLWVMDVFDGKPRGSPQMVKPNFGSFIDRNWFTSLGFTRDGSYYYKAWTRETELYVAILDPATNRLHGPTELVSQVGWRTSPAWSRDGRYLAYAWGRGTAYDPFILGIRSAQTGEERRLRLDGLIRHGGHGFDPRWSPDGRFILADARERDYAGPLMDSQGLYGIDVQTGSVTPLVQTTAAIAGIDSPAWSPDGRVIFERRPPLGDRSRIVTRDLETGKERELYRAVPPAQVHHWPTSNLAVSPDGQQLAFVWTDAKNVERATALMVLPTAGGEPRELLRAQDPAWIGVTAWPPDSRHIIYARSVYVEKPTFELWRISADGGEPQKLGLVMEGLEPYGLTIHPDGKRIAFTAGTGREEVWVLKNFLPGAKAPGEGSRILFDSNRSGSDEIYVMDADGSSVRQLTNIGRKEVSSRVPDWSPDRGRIVFQSNRTGPWGDLYVMDADGGNLRQLTDTPDTSEGGPAWSPDARRIAYNRAAIAEDGTRGRSQIWIVDADGSNARALTSGTSRNWYPAWSSDGSMLAFASDRDGDIDLYLMNADGTDVRQLTNAEGDDAGPAWSPDGREIAFDSMRDGNWELYLMAADGSNVRRLTHTPDRSEARPAWSPDGKRIAFNAGKEGALDTYEICVVNADGSNQQCLTKNDSVDAHPDWR